MRKETVKAPKRVNMVTIIAASVCVVLVAILLYVCFFADMLAGRFKLSELRKNIVDCEIIVLSDPLYDGGVLPVAGETVVTGDDADTLAKEFLSATEKLSFDRVKSGKLGFWEVCLSFEISGERYAVYLCEESLYVADDNAYVFRIKSKKINEYKAFYQKVEKIIDQASE